MAYSSVSARPSVAVITHSDIVPAPIAGVDICPLSERKKGTLRLLRGIARSIYFAFQSRPRLIHLNGVHVRDYGGVFGEPTILAYALCRLLGIRVQLTLHSVWLRSDFPPTRRLLYWYYLLICDLYLLAMSEVRVLVAGERSELLESWRNQLRFGSRAVPEIHPCATVHLDVDSRRETRRRLGLRDEFLFLTPGFVREDKGIHILLEAARILPLSSDATVAIVGAAHRASDKAYESRIHRMVSAFAGKVNLLFKNEIVDEDELADWFAAADCVVLPYMRAVGASGPLHQALGFALPVVATAVGQQVAMTGAVALVPPDSPEELSAVMARVATDVDFRSDLRKKATAYARAHSWSSLASEVACK